MAGRYGLELELTREVWGSITPTALATWIPIANKLRTLFSIFRHAFVYLQSYEVTVHAGIFTIYYMSIYLSQSSLL